MIQYFKDKLYGVTMYRLLLYYLLAILATAVLLSHFKLLPFAPIYLIYSTFLISLFSWVTNTIFARSFKAQTNIESVYITALILALLISPPASFLNSGFVMTAFWVSVLANASKYILARGKKHIFNPAAIALVLAGFFLGQPASWWVGTIYLAPVVFLGGLLITRKIGRFPMVLVYFAASLLPIIFFKQITELNGLLAAMNTSLFYSPLFFLGFVMLTEPLTSPGTRGKQLVYAGLVGLLSSPYFHLGTLVFTPELALIMGNIYTYLVSPRSKLVLKLKEKLEIAADTFEFVFEKNSPASFIAGQYVEWTLPHLNADARGNRRYFTISSAPSDPEVRFGVKFPSRQSSFKRAMLGMQAGDLLYASSAAGDFILPKDVHKKIAFLAGGIGITPFRSMVQELQNQKQTRDIVLLYSAKTEKDLAYASFFRQARDSGLKTIFNLTETGGRRIDKGIVQQNIPDYLEREFYICGPQQMLDSMRTILQSLGVPKKQIHTESFG